MFGRLMNSYYYGKSGKGDYRKDDLPQNRWQLFREMLRIRLSGLFRLNLMTIVAWIPMILVLSTLFSFVVNLDAIVTDGTSGTEQSAEDLAIYTQYTADPSSYIYGVLFTACLFMIPAIAITGPVSAGIAYVTRNWARDEHAFIWADFRDAVKSNWKQALGVSLITGILPFMLLVCNQFYGTMAETNMFFIVPRMLVWLLALIWCLGLVFIYPMMVTYQMKFGRLLKNSLLLGIARLPMTVGTRLAALIPAIIALTVSLTLGYTIYALLALAAYYVLLGNSMSRFIFASFTNSVFDKYINPHIEGAEINRGLSKEEDDDAEEEEPAKS